MWVYLALFFDLQNGKRHRPHYYRYEKQMHLNIYIILMMHDTHFLRSFHICTNKFNEWIANTNYLFRCYKNFQKNKTYRWILLKYNIITKFILNY